MYSHIFCKVYNEFGWNYYPEIFGERLLIWLRETGRRPGTAMDLACGTGILCGILERAGIRAAGMDLSEGMIAIARENCPGIPFTVADMTAFCPEERYDLVTCTGDAVNHIPDLSAVAAIFRNVRTYLAPGGVFVFDLLRESEVSDSEPFEMDFDAHTRVWFQMTRPAPGKVNLCIRVYEDGVQTLEETIRETIHNPDTICTLLREAGFRTVTLTDRLPPNAETPATTFFVIAQ